LKYTDDFVSEYEHMFEAEYGYFRHVVQEVVEKKALHYID
jgi:hypothetical protein